MPVSTFWHEVRRRVHDRAPRGLAVYFLLATLSLAYEAVTYPDRVPLVLTAWVASTFLAAATLLLVRSKPQWSVELVTAGAGMAGAVISLYHIQVGATAEWLLLVLTGLLCATSLFFPWGWRSQLLASTGALVGFPVALLAGLDPQNPAATGLTYLACVVGLSCYGAELNQQHLKNSFYLTRGIAAREMRLRSYLDQALIGIGVLSPDGTWREVNAALCRLVGCDAEDLVGHVWMEVLHPKELASGSTELSTISHGDGSAATVDVRLRAKDGREVDACIASRSFHSPDGRPEETVLMILDITDRKRAQDELEFARDAAESAYNSKSEFLAHMSHELRTPMNIIFGMTEIAMDESASNEQLEVLGRTRDAAKSLLVLVDEVLDLSRIETGRMRLHAREFALREWLGEVVEPMRTLAEAKGLALDWNVDADAPDRVLGDPDRMRQIVVNLVGNAIKFTDRGSVSVRVGRSDGPSESELQFSVEDSGIGVPPLQRARIFEAFVQGDDPKPGTGLGLTICARLVELMGGRIWLESEEGQGSRFHFTAPGARRFEA